MFDSASLAVIIGMILFLAVFTYLFIIIRKWVKNRKN